MRAFFYILIFLLSGKISSAQKPITIQFINFANGKKIVLNDSSYTNSSGGNYTVSKLKYYVSNIHFVTATKNKKVTANVFLIDASSPQKILLPKPAEQITGVEFLLGVDSLLNCSGAQSGALDPLNDMFWTWNTGYVMFKLEGASNSSNADRQRIEQHIGGYKNEFRTMRKIFIPVNYDKKTDPGLIDIGLNLDKYWNAEKNITITKNPLIVSPGSLASTAADGFLNMFFLFRKCCYWP